MNLYHDMGTDFKVNQQGFRDLCVNSATDGKFMLRVLNSSMSTSYCKIKNTTGGTLYKVPGFFHRKFDTTDDAGENNILAGTSNHNCRKMKVCVTLPNRAQPRFIIRVAERNGSVAVFDIHSQNVVTTLGQKLVFALIYSMNDANLHVDQGYNVPVLILLMYNTLYMRKSRK